MQKSKETDDKSVFLILQTIKSDIIFCMVPSRPRYATFAVVAGFHGLRWWKTMSALRFYAQQAVGQRTTRPAWRTGTATGNQKGEQGGRAGSGSLLSPGPVSAALLLLFPTLG